MANQQVINIVLNSKQGDELPIANSVGNADWIIFWNNTNDRLERISSQNYRQTQNNNFITISSNVFRHIKGYTSGALNTSSSLEINDIISNGIIVIGVKQILIKSAIYLNTQNDNNNENFGTFDANTGVFSNGNYDVIEYLEIN